jgi:hypothetical protein
MLMRRSEGTGTGPLGRPPSGRGQGFFTAPSWRLLLWIVIFLAVVVVAEVLGIT